MDANDLVQIHQLLGHYGHLVDAKQWDRLGEVFTPDGVFDVTRYGMERCTGLEAVTKFFASATHPPAHHMVNVYVFEEGGTTRARSKWLIPDGSGMSGGDYLDVLVRTPGGWRVRERFVEPRWSTNTSTYP